MIIQDETEIWLNSNHCYDAIAYWTEKGHTNLRPQQKLKVKVVDLPKFSAAMVMFKCDDCGVEWKRRYSKKFTAKVLYVEDYCHKCSRKHTGARQDKTKSIEQLRAKTGSNHPRWNKDKKSFLAYAYKVRRITEANYAKDVYKLNPDGLPRTRCGVDGGFQLDHKVSVRAGYKWGINPRWIGATDNLQMLPWKINRTKHGGF